MAASSKVRSGSRALVSVSAAPTADGMVVTLAGRLGRAAAPQLRQALLAPVEPGLGHVVVDAGGVTEVSEPCLAVLLAAAAWTIESGGEFVYARVGEPLRALAEEVGLAGLLEPDWDHDELAEVIPFSRG